MRTVVRCREPKTNSQAYAERLGRYVAMKGAAGQYTHIMLDMARLRLNKVEQRHEQELRLMKAELTESGYTAARGLDANVPFTNYLEHIEKMFTDPPEGRVAELYYVAELESHLVGWVSVRTTLNRQLRAEGGHIGYAVRPRYRNQGAAKEILRQALGVVAAFDIGPALVTCDADNKWSRATIEANGGVLDTRDGDSKDGEGLEPCTGVDAVGNKLRFWVPTPTNAENCHVEQPQVRGIYNKPKGHHEKGSVVFDGKVVARDPAVLGAENWALTNRVVRDPDLGDAYAEVEKALKFNESTLLVAVENRTLEVAEGLYSDLQVMRSQFIGRSRTPVKPQQHGAYAGGVGSNVCIITSDGWVAFAVRSAACTTGSAGKVVASVGEMATPHDVRGGTWSSARTAVRGLEEELQIVPGEYSLHCGERFLIAGGDVVAVYVANVMLTREHVTARAAAAEDKWERENLVWIHEKQLGAALENGLTWASWGALSYAVACRYLGVPLADRVKFT